MWELSLLLLTDTDHVSGSYWLSTSHCYTTRERKMENYLNSRTCRSAKCIQDNGGGTTGFMISMILTHCPQIKTYCCTHHRKGKIYVFSTDKLTDCFSDLSKQTCSYIGKYLSTINTLYAMTQINIFLQQHKHRENIVYIELYKYKNMWVVCNSVLQVVCNSVLSSAIRLIHIKSFNHSKSFKCQLVRKSIVCKKNLSISLYIYVT